MGTPTRGWLAWLGVVCALSGSAGCSDKQKPDEPLAQAQLRLGQPFGSETEPNPDFATATPIANDAVVRADIYRNADVDYYSFSALAGDRVYAATMTAFSANGVGDSVLTLYGSDGTTVLETDDSDGVLNQNASSIAGTLIPSNGTYYLSVRHSSATTQTRPYDLHFRVQTGSPAVETEPNDTVAEPLPSSGWVTGALSSGADVDIYSLTVNAGDTIFASLDLDPERDGDWNGQISLGLFNGTNLLFNDTGPGPAPDSEAAFVTVANAGTYTVTVSSPGASPFGTYGLSVSVHPAVAQANCTTYNSTDTPVVIPAGAIGLTTSTIMVPGNPRIGDLDVSIVANHAFPMDLDIHLLSPAGNNNGLITDVGSATFPDWNFTLDDESAFPAGSFGLLNGQHMQPELNYRLHWFDGEDAGGAWTLAMYDDTAANGGTLNSWSLRICEQPSYACTGQVTYFLTDFESGPAGFTVSSSPTEDWQYGTVTSTTAPISNCNGGTQCWKTNLAGFPRINGTSDLKSAPIDLTAASGASALTFKWAMKYSIESANFEHAYVQIQEVGGANPKILWEFKDATMGNTVSNSPTVMITESAGWGDYYADIRAYAGKTVELVFHWDTDATVLYQGVAIDDLSITQCPSCGDGAVGAGEQCDDGNTTNGDCCSSTCQYESAGSACADADLCNGNETCNGTGTCSAGTPPTVDDGNPCTTDACSALGGVTNTPVSLGTACADGNLCNGNETCDAVGTCVAGTPPTVDDGNPCTTDACTAGGGVTNTPVSAGTACPDGNLCNGNEVCDAAGTCNAGSLPIVDDGNPCTVDACTAGGGVTNTPVANGTACADGNLCNGNETCSSGVCTAGTPPTVDDGNPCTADACTAGGGVTHIPVTNGTACADGNLCNGNETCSSGVCTAGIPPTVDDGNPCTADACTAGGGVTNTPVTNGTACADGNLCNGNETCSSGVCTAGTPPTVDDGNPCTADACTAGGGVTHTPVTNGTACADGNLCNGNETCSAGTCLAGIPPTVDDGNPCTADACTAGGGVTHTPVTNGTACADGNLCNGNETCSAGTCIAGTPPTVDDGNPCTADACTAGGGVTHTPVATGTACADGNLCNGNETCNASGTCMPGLAPIVNDNNPCTTDTCVPATGVAHTPVAAGVACPDGNLCNGNELCNASGTCVAGTAPVVNDNNPCTTDTCVPATGVAHTPVATGTACPDADLCNGDEACNATGVCVPTSPPVADDGNPCTIDACDPETGVTHEFVELGESCADEDLCNGDETCDGAGVCVDGEAPVVDDENPCTADACDALTGVSHEPLAEGSTCADEDLCNGDEACNAGGVCTAGTPVVCSALDACHVAGVCDSDTGICSNPSAPDGTACPGGTCATGVCEGEGGAGGEGGIGNAGAAGEGGAAGDGPIGPVAGTTSQGGTGGSGGSAGHEPTAGEPGEAGSPSTGGTGATSGTGGTGATSGTGGTGVGAEGGSGDGGRGGSSGRGGAPTAGRAGDETFPEGATFEGGGCNCRTSGGERNSNLAYLAAAAALVVLRRRRRARAA